MILDQALKCILYLPSGSVLAYLVYRLVRPAHRRLFYVLLTMVPTAMGIVYGFFAESPGSRTAYTVIMFTETILVILLMGRESVFRRCIAVALYFLVMFVTELITASLYFSAGGQINPLTMTPLVTRFPAQFVFLQVATFVVYIALTFVCLWLWQRYVLKTPIKILWYYALFPASQAAILGLALSFSNQSTDIVASRYIQLSIAMLFCVVTDALLFRSMGQLTDRALAEEQSNWLESLLFQQQSYYDQILLDVEDASRVRHDIRNQLQTAYALMAQGDTPAAQEQLDEIAHYLDKAPTYCPHRVVNAILAIKASCFTEANIPFVCRCDLPADLPLTGVELCSLFSNVLDNAYRATVSCPESLDRTVTLTAGIQGEHLILTCANPVPENPKPRSETGHGLGLGILKELANHHNGELKTEQTDGVFKTTLWMQLEAPIPECVTPS